MSDYQIKVARWIYNLSPNVKIGLRDALIQDLIRLDIDATVGKFNNDFNMITFKSSEDMHLYKLAGNIRYVQDDYYRYLI